MEMKDQEKVRMAEMALLLSGGVIHSVLRLKGFNSDIDVVSNLMGVPYVLDVISSFKTQKITNEWKELKKIDDKIVSNTANLIDNIGNNDPIGIFASYVYLYRKGYLSYNKNFIYDIDMKDFATLLSIDVYRGKGVCRSISELLTKIYREFGYDSKTLVVNANKKAIKDNIHLSNISLQKSQNSGELVNKVMKITGAMHTPNHAITLVSDGVNSYKLDPTNDCMFLSGEKNKFLSPTCGDGIVTNYKFLNFLYSILSFLDNGFNCFDNVQSQKLDINFEEYKELYLQAFEICNQNEKLFDYFYEDNEPLYEKANEISNTQNNILKRLIPIIPKSRK